MDSTPNSNAHVANDKGLQSTLTTKMPPQNTITVNRNQSHFLGPVEKKPIGFLDLPFEIRSMIYKLCFVRSFGIVQSGQSIIRGTQLRLPRNTIY
jgi:hypothetical protein